MRASQKALIGFGFGAALGLCAFASGAHAQIASAPLSPQSGSPWSFAVTPYVWLPTLSTTYSLTGPRGATVTSTTSAGIGDYISELNFGLMVGAEARYNRFTLMTDLVYANASVTTSNNHFSSVNLSSGAVNIARDEQLSTGSRLAMTIWSLEGGYTVFQGDWGNLDAVAGMRMLFINGTSNYTLAADILGPNRTTALSRDGSLNLGDAYAEGVGGVAGRINIPNSKFFLPFYLDAGGGSVPFTWQAYAGTAYRATSWLDISLGYRYLDFNGGSKTSGVDNYSLRGVMLVGNIRF
jgi:opacity protein-like surface antigen